MWTKWVGIRLEAERNVYDRVRGCWEGIAYRRLGRATVMLMDNRQGQDRDGHLTSKVPSVGTSSEGTEEEEVGSIL